MREIKFRAWNKKKNAWDTFITEFVDYENKTISLSIPENSHLIIMQFTGLHDKNGREIYEGDIVKRVILKEKHFKVVWDNKYSCFMGMDIHDDSHDIILSQWELEVIGNIYENPTL